jgi:hypothetical protein
MYYGPTTKGLPKKCLCLEGIPPYWYNGGEDFLSGKVNGVVG